MKQSFSIAVWMTLASIVVKLLLFKMEIPLEKSATYIAFFNLLVVSVGTFFAIRQYKLAHRDSQSFKEEAKAGMRTAAFYALMISIFVFVYYRYIDADAFPQMVEKRVEAAMEANAANESGTQIDIKQVRDVSTFIFSPRTHSTITLFGFLVAGAIYSMLVTYFLRRVPGFK